MAQDPLRLSILEYGYQSRDKRLRSGLEFTLAMAQLAEDCGYSRLWFTEHHHEDIKIAAPEIVIATVAAQTRRIRVGSAGILLHYYSPWKVAEVFHTLATLFPGRIDLGLARGMGAYPDIVARMYDGAPPPQDLAAFNAMYERKAGDLHGYLRAAFDGQKQIESTAPLAAMPELWMMGAGSGSAGLASRLGAKLAHWYLASPPAAPADATRSLEEAAAAPPPSPIAADCISIVGICAETDAEAQALVNAAAEGKDRPVTADFCGSPERCREAILAMAARHGAREVVVRNYLCGPDAAERMYRLLAEVLLPKRGIERGGDGLSRAA